MKPQAVRTLCTGYNDMDPLLFSSRLRSLQKNIAIQNERIVSNKWAHDHDRQLYPVEQFITADLPRWNGLRADELLKESLSLGRYVFGAPKLLYESLVTMKLQHYNYLPSKRSVIDDTLRRIILYVCRTYGLWDMFFGWIEDISRFSATPSTQHNNEMATMGTLRTVSQRVTRVERRYWCLWKALDAGNNDQ
jgi:hypothetical protein